MPLILWTIPRRAGLAGGGPAPRVVCAAGCSRPRARSRLLRLDQQRARLTPRGGRCVARAAGIHRAWRRADRARHRDGLQSLGAGSFDVVLASNLLEHFSPDAAAMVVRDVAGCFGPAAGFIIIQPNFRFAWRRTSTTIPTGRFSRTSRSRRSCAHRASASST